MMNNAAGNGRSCKCFWKCSNSSLDDGAQAGGKITELRLLLFTHGKVLCEADSFENIRQRLATTVILYYVFIHTTDRFRCFTSYSLGCNRLISIGLSLASQGLDLRPPSERLSINCLYAQLCVQFCN
jgi:hypothetical protein